MDTITMSVKETERIPILDRVVAKELRQKQAAVVLGISVRQLRRIIKTYKREGAKSLPHKLRGAKGNRTLKPELMNKVVTLASTTYRGFGPTLLQEKLLEDHGMKLGVETIRVLLIHEKLWEPNQHRRAVLHPIRERRACFGELIQIDGSPHDWFEGRREKCTLLVFIDDATGKLVSLLFAESETTIGYFQAAKIYLEKFGRPIAFYSDRHSIFRITPKEKRKGNLWGAGATDDIIGLTQFGRACQELSIETICANSPQAKGRVERMNQTLQDRLTKELRLKGISTIEAANQFLPEYINSFNQKFAVTPTDPTNAHRPLLSTKKLDEIFTLQYERTLSKNLIFSYNTIQYQVVTSNPMQVRSLRGTKILIQEDLQGNRTFHRGKQQLTCTMITDHPKASAIVGSKYVNDVMDALMGKDTIRGSKTSHTPPIDHPWRRMQI
jgi:transposase